ncbi:MAG: YkgJ family cysteine cluster protein [Cyanobacteria bacterium P01_H01_bin.58]
MAHWQCIQGCGACCHLDPSERPELDQYLTPTELEHYLSFVGEDGWCINYDQVDRRCRIYENRPRFCRVQANTFEDMFGIQPEELNEFAIACCEQQIEGVYGSASEELSRFTVAIAAVEDEGSNA